MNVSVKLSAMLYWKNTSCIHHVKSDCLMIELSLKNKSTRSACWMVKWRYGVWNVEKSVNVDGQILLNILAWYSILMVVNNKNKKMEKTRWEWFNGVKYLEDKDQTDNLRRYIYFFYSSAWHNWSLCFRTPKVPTHTFSKIIPAGLMLMERDIRYLFLYWPKRLNVVGTDKGKKGQLIR